MNVETFVSFHVEKGGEAVSSHSMTELAAALDNYFMKCGFTFRPPFDIGFNTGKKGAET